MSSSWPILPNEQAESTADRASRRLRATLLVGAALTVVVWIAAALFFGQRVATLQQQSDAVGVRYVRAQQLVNDARTQVLLSSLDLRESLIEPDEALAEERRGRVTSALDQADLALASYLPILDTSDEPQRVIGLRADLAVLRREMEKLLVADARRSPAVTAAFLRSQLAPRREAVVQLAQEIGRLNRSAYVAYQVETVGFSRRIQRDLVRTLGLALVASLGIGALAGLRATRLERQVRAHAQVDRRLRADLHRLSASLIKVREDERRSIARELHDEIGQMLTAAKMELTVAEQPAAAASGMPFDGVRAILDQALQATRDLSRLLHPAVLDDLGLVSAIGEQVRSVRERHGIDVLFEPVGLEGRLPPDIELAAYRIVQEGLTNIARHARATRCRVSLAARDGQLTILIEDAGRGFSSTSETRGLGLVGMRERVALLSGTIAIQSEPGRGTRVQVTLPLGVGQDDAAPDAAVSEVDIHERTENPARR